MSSPSVTSFHVIQCKCSSWKKYLLSVCDDGNQNCDIRDTHKERQHVEKNECTQCTITTVTEIVKGWQMMRNRSGSRASSLETRVIPLLSSLSTFLSTSDSVTHFFLCLTNDLLQQKEVYAFLVVSACFFLTERVRKYQSLSSLVTPLSSPAWQEKKRHLHEIMHVISYNNSEETRDREVGVWFFLFTARSF